MPTNQTWFTLHLADPPTITGISNSHPALAQSTVTLTGTGDPTDTITIWDNALMLGTGAIVDATGHWTITVNLLTVGDHNLFATQTVNQLPQAGTLTSARGNEVDADVYPDAPVITFVSTPGPTTTTAPVTVSGTATPGYTVKVYDGTTFKGSVVVSAGGTWSFTMNLGRRQPLGRRHTDVDDGAGRPVHERPERLPRSPSTRRRRLRPRSRRPRAP